MKVMLSVQDYGFDDWYQSNFVKDYTLEKSCEDVVVKVPPSYHKHTDHVSPNSFDLILSSLTYLPLRHPLCVSYQGPLNLL